MYLYVLYAIVPSISLPQKIQGVNNFFIGLPVSPNCLMDVSSSHWRQLPVKISPGATLCIIIYVILIYITRISEVLDQNYYMCIYIQTLFSYHMTNSYLQKLRSRMV